jgi:hypothetical protein
MRHGFDSLILMCGVHHKVIDDDEESYTVQRLTGLKSATKLPGKNVGR